MVLDVVLSWDLSPTPAADVTEQRVYRSVAVNPSFPEDYTQIATLGGEVTTYTDTDVIPDPDLPLTYAVTAANSGVESSPTTAGADALYDTTPIDVSLSWNLSPSELSSVDGQRLYRSFVENPTFPDNYTQIASLTASETSYIDTNALQTETYNYGVTTFNSAGESSPTTTAVNTPYPVKVDGDFVYTLTANGADVTGIQVNGQAVLGAPVIPDSVVDNFELDPDGVYAESDTVADYYSGDTAEYSITETSPLEGSRSLETTVATVSDAVSYPGDGLNNYPAQGDVILVRYWAENFGTSDPPIDGLLFGVDSTVDEFYFLQFDGEADILNLRKFPDDTSLGDATVSWQSQETYTVKVDWNNSVSTDITVGLYDSSDTLVTDFTAAESEYSHQGIGVRSYTFGTAEQTRRYDLIEAGDLVYP